MEYNVMKKNSIPLAKKETYKNTKSRIDTGLSQERTNSRDVIKRKGQLSPDFGRQPI